MNIGIIILMIVGGGVGLLSTLYLILAIPVVLGFKFFRKIKSGISLFN